MADVADCGADLGCFIQASRSAHLAKVKYTMAVDFFGLLISATDALAIEGTAGDKLLFSTKRLQAEAKISDAAAKALRDQGASDADIQQQVQQSKANVQQAVGTGKQCQYPQADLLAMLQRWQQGEWSSSDWDPAVCTDTHSLSGRAAQRRW